MVAFVCSQFVLHAQSDYKSALGIRATTHITFDMVSLSYKTFLSDHNAIEINAGYGGRNMSIPMTGGRTAYSPAISLSGSYQYHEDIYTATDEHLRWFAGAGLNFFNIFSEHQNYKGFGTALFGTAGLDYKFKAAPVNLSFDWRPSIYVISPSEFLPIQIGTIGLSARYTF